MVKNTAMQTEEMTSVGRDERKAEKKTVGMKGRNQRPELKCKSEAQGESLSYVMVWTSWVIDWATH